MHVFLWLCVYLRWFTDKENVLFDCLAVQMLNNGLTEASGSETERDEFTQRRRDSRETGGLSGRETNRRATVKHRGSEDGRQAGRVNTERACV